MNAVRFLSLIVCCASVVWAQDSRFETKVIELPPGFPADQRDLVHGQFFTIQEFIEKKTGVSFPEGTSLKLGFKGRNLQIVHEPAVIEKIEKLVVALSLERPKSIQLQCEIFEVDALTGLKLQQKTAGESDHLPVREELLQAVNLGEASAVSAMTMLVTSGHRGKVSDVEEFQYATEFDWDESGDVSIPVAFETRDVGTVFEADPIVGADRHTIDINFSLEYHSAPPLMRKVEVKTGDGRAGQMYGEMPEFHSKRIVTSLTMIKGQTILIGAWKPTGRSASAIQNPVHLIFLRADLVEAKAE